MATKTDVKTKAKAKASKTAAKPVAVKTAATKVAAKQSSNPGKKMRDNGHVLIQAWVTPALKAAILSASREQGVKMSNVVRETLHGRFGGGSVAKPKPKPVVTPAKAKTADKAHAKSATTATTNTTNTTKAKSAKVTSPTKKVTKSVTKAAKKVVTKGAKVAKPVYVDDGSKGINIGKGKAVKPAKPAAKSAIKSPSKPKGVAGGRKQGVAAKSPSPRPTTDTANPTAAAPPALNPPEITPDTAEVGIG